MDPVSTYLVLVAICHSWILDNSNILFQWFQCMQGELEYAVGSVGNGYVTQNTVVRGNCQHISALQYFSYTFE